MFDLPSQENVKEVIIDKDVVLSKKEPIVVYSKNKDITDKSSAA
jgi:ATP-dependent protease Clp ATPase subunit